jgi:hypothetical protein
VRSAIEHFRTGNDQLGLDNLLNSMVDLENLLEFEYSADGLCNKMDKITPVLRDLCRCIKNQDVTGLTDVLEFTLYPLTTEWIEGCE